MERNRQSNGGFAVFHVSSSTISTATDETRVTD